MSETHAGGYLKTSIIWNYNFLSGHSQIVAAWIYCKNCYTHEGLQAEYS